MTHQIFISYRRDDTRHIAGRLADHLEEHFPSADVFMDVDGIDPGSDFVASIRKAVGKCDVLIAVIGRRWLSVAGASGDRRIDQPNDYVALEVATALKRGIPVIPILVDEAKMPGQEDLPGELRDLTYRNAARIDHELFRTDIQRVFSAIERAISPLQVQLQIRDHSDESAGPPPANASFNSSELPSFASPVGIPIHRSVIRIGLWWGLSSSLTLTACAVFLWIKSSSRPHGAFSALSGFYGFTLLFMLSALIAEFLRREIQAERDILDEAAADKDDPARRPVSQKHVLAVAACCTAGSVGLALLAVLTATASG